MPQDATERRDGSEGVGWAGMRGRGGNGSTEGMARRAGCGFTTAVNVAVVVKVRGSDFYAADWEGVVELELARTFPPCPFVD